MSTTKVLLWGAGGTNIGHWIAKILASDSRFDLTILARNSSKTQFPDVRVIYIDPSLENTELVKAFQGQDVVISAIGFTAKYDERKLIDAAVDAGVKRFIPSEYGLNNTNPAARQLSPVFDGKGDTWEYLKSKESTGLTWTTFGTGIWLDWALQPQISFIGIDIVKHSATLFDGGHHRISFTTLPSAADGLRRVLLNLESTANKVLTISNFERSQNEIIATLEQFQGVQYSISNLDSVPYIKENKEKWQAEKSIPAAINLVKAGFLLDGYGSNFPEEGLVPLSNELLGLPELTFDEVIKKAVH